MVYIRNISFLENQFILGVFLRILPFSMNAHIEFNYFINCLHNDIKSFKHEIFLITETKVAITPYDYKRHLIKNNFKILP